MKTLELKHLAPYLPYKLELFCSNGTIVDLDKDYFDEDWSCGYKDGHLKPILHPLSSLTKEIEVNGEKFVPFDNMYLKAYKEICELTDEADPSKIIEAMPYYIYIKLFEWHFDCFSLIENNLAIDINTLTKTLKENEKS